jgi:hypothetical protein
MNARTFDPFFLDRIDEGFAAEEDVPDDDALFFEQCHICGDDELVREADGQLLDLNGEPHECPEV